MKNSAKTLWLLVAFCIMSGCAAQRPVLYPNDRYKAVGEEKAQQEIDHCLKLADDAGTDDDRAAELAKRTGTAVVVGGATGAVVGAITGAVGRGSLVGAAAGGSVALLSGLFKASEPTPIYKRFVEFCLFEKGYQPIGWR
ncbi:glycine zipper family protein [Trichlorobacter ammonificans]|uniref:Glycine-zipper-containing OmpA-like membrane domain-containing protein n=1 Tax=Trichlorobacter ammonificans TaxID=2916410 RepID=A0ABM9DBN5_9BACT|nr:glycine zipper family protein [Trichlorobacter ammonificans]CAH2032090.1 conserved exported protein of unknown function [Trichlorobacter ammonificans]